jgi:hypothetical protein
VATVFKGSAPNATLVALKPRVGPLSCNWYVSDTLPADTHALNTALEDPAGTVTEPGTDTALLLLLSTILRLFTTSWLIVTVQLSEPSALTELEVHDNPVN